MKNKMKFNNIDYIEKYNKTGTIRNVCETCMSP